MIPRGADDLELHLLLELSDEATRLRRRQSVIASALAHLAVVIAVLIYARMFPAPRQTTQRRPDQHITLLFPMPRELTQKEPNQGPRSKLFVGEREPVRPPLMFTPKTLPATPGPKPTPPPKGDLGREEPPQLALKPELQTPGLPMTPVPAPAQAPKLVLEDANKAGGSKNTNPAQLGPLAQQRAGSIVEGAVRDLSHQQGQGGTIVGDGTGGGVPDGFTLPSRGNAGSNLELLSDPMGVDFRPYLTRILAMVRRNWYAVIPESARLGMVKGRVAIQFIIVRKGGVSKLVIASASGQEALDRAAVAGISASNPFPPLPSEFRGDQIKLQFTFLYNIPVNR